MKRYLTFIFVILSMITIIIGYRFDVRWAGMVTWIFVIILLLLAAYFTKYISSDKNGGKHE